MSCWGLGQGVGIAAQESGRDLLFPSCAAACTSLPHNPAPTPTMRRYSFPRLHLPPKAIAAAKAAGKTPDTFYCLQVGGSGARCCSA